MKRTLAILFSIAGLTACKEELVILAPEPIYARDDSGALFCSFDAALLGGFLHTLGLPSPDPVLSEVEGGSGESFAVAMQRLADEQTGEAYGELGMFFHKYRRFDLAEACYRVAAERQPDAAWWPHYRGDLAENREELDSAVQFFSEAIRLALPAPEPRTRKARALRTQGNSSLLRAEVEQLLNLDPNSLFALTELASIALDESDLESAEPLLQRALASWPRQRRVHVLFARLHSLAGRPAEAQRFSRSAEQSDEITTLLIDPWMARLEAVTNSILFWKTGAEELQRAGLWDDLLRVTEELDRRETGPHWKSKQVQALVFLDRSQEAEELARTVTTSYAESPLGFEVLAMAQLANQKYSSALASARRALALDGGSWFAHEMLVKSLVATGQAEQAIEAVEDFRAQFPDSYGPLALAFFVHQSLGTAALDEDREAEAARHIVAIEGLLPLAELRAPTDPNYQAAKTWLDTARGRLTE